MVEEFWMDNERMLHHLRTDEYRRVLLTIEMAEEPPEIRFDKILRISGLEAIKNAGPF